MTCIALLLSGVYVVYIGSSLVDSPMGPRAIWTNPTDPQSSACEFAPSRTINESFLPYGLELEFDLMTRENVLFPTRLIEPYLRPYVDPVLLKYGFPKSCGARCNDKQAWKIEAEAEDSVELVTPVLYPGRFPSIEVIANITHEFLQYPLTRGAPGYFGATHINVEAENLVRNQNALGLLNLLKVWEDFFPRLKIYAQASSSDGISRRGQKFARSLGDRFPQVYKLLMEQADTSIEAVTKVFMTVEKKDFAGAASLWLNESHDGLRQMGINLCRILDIPCCLNCEHNSQNHIPVLEFRVFDLEVGAQLHLMVTLIQGVVQYVSAATDMGLDLRGQSMVNVSFAQWLGCFGLQQQVKLWVPADERIWDAAFSQKEGILLQLTHTKAGAQKYTSLLIQQMKERQKKKKKI